MSCPFPSERKSGWIRPERWQATPFPAAAWERKTRIRTTPGLLDESRLRTRIRMRRMLPLASSSCGVTMASPIFLTLENSGARQFVSLLCGSEKSPKTAEFSLDMSPAVRLIFARIVAGKMTAYDAQGNATIKDREQESSKSSSCGVAARQQLEDAYRIIQKLNRIER